MSDILHELKIAAPPASVYKALTTREGIQGWFTRQPEVEARVGGKITLGFREGQWVIELSIARLEPDREIEWTVTQGQSEWDGTRITWQLSPEEGSTRVRFGHLDFASSAGRFAQTNYAWAWYLTSLKDYLETGTGRPDQYQG